MYRVMLCLSCASKFDHVPSVGMYLVFMFNNGEPLGMNKSIPVLGAVNLWIGF